MAKALYGHLASDPALIAQLQHLRRRVEDLEEELQALRAENDALASVVTGQELVQLGERSARPEVVLT